MYISILILYSVEKVGDSPYLYIINMVISCQNKNESRSYLRNERLLYTIVPTYPPNEGLL